MAGLSYTSQFEAVHATERVNNGAATTGARGLLLQHYSSASAAFSTSARISLRERIVTGSVDSP